MGGLADVAWIELRAPRRGELAMTMTPTKEVLLLG
jgi:hypothetical protein